MSDDTRDAVAAAILPTLTAEPDDIGAWAIRTAERASDAALAAVAAWLRSDEADDLAGQQVMDTYGPEFMPFGVAHAALEALAEALEGTARHRTEGGGGG